MGVVYAMNFLVAASKEAELEHEEALTLMRGHDGASAMRRGRHVLEAA